MTTDVAEGRKLAKLAAAAEAEHGIKFLVNNTANWRAQAVQAASLVESGGIGRVEHVVCVMHAPLLWLFDDPANVGWCKPTGTMAGNGFGYGQLSHLLAWVFKVSGLAPTEAYCAMTLSEASGADLTDAAVIRCSNGATIALSGAASIPGNAHDGEANECKHISVRMFGSAGMLTYEGADQVEASGSLELSTRDGTRRRVAEGFLFENYEAEGDGPESLHAFIDACRGGQPFIGVGAAVGLQVVQALDAMYMSAKSGKSEKVK